MSYDKQTFTKISFMQFNIQGITNTSFINKLMHVLNESHIDVVFINETFLKPINVLKIVNYSVYRKYRSKHGGGILIAIKNTIHNR